MRPEGNALFEDGLSSILDVRPSSSAFPHAQLQLEEDGMSTGPEFRRLNIDTNLTEIMIHESLLLFLRDACSTLEPSLNASVQKTLDRYTLSMASNNLVSAILASLEFRKILLELSSKLGLTNNPRLRAAQRKDDQRIAAVLVSIFNSKFEEAVVLGLEGDSAQCFLDVVQSALDKGFLLREDHSRMARRIIRKLSESCDRLPSSLFISGVTGREEYPTFGGGYGDIYRALHNSKPVALKRMRYFLRGADLRRINLKFCREALVWKDLHHPYILPFLGIDRDSFPSALCMVSPWMEHGTVMDYLKNHGHENVDKLLYEVAQGLQYLHSRNIVHGDLRGGNILVDEDWNACLADFGLSMFTDVTSTMTTNRGGSPYWMAPELIDPDRLYTGRPPFANLNEAAAMMKTLDGKRPERPVGPPAVSDILWHHISTYWAENPEARPATQLVVQNMKSLYPLVVPNFLSPPASPSPPMSRSSTPSLLSPIDPHLTSPTFADGVSPGPVGDQHIILYDYTEPTDDPNQTPISFNGGDTVHVLDQQGMWCEVVKVDGSIGSKSMVSNLFGLIRAV
ncbi:kinase-like domain-containing protein [Mycena olivaceomarginata]|nr:kinase-like domain-containing protein [Mycena olivaceomarginata]